MMKLSVSFVALLSLIPLATALPNGSAKLPPTPVGLAALPTGTSNAGLAVVAKAAGKKYFGSATDNPELSDAPYVAQLSNTKDFNQITPGNTMKWDATEPSRNTFTFTRADEVVALAQKNGQILRGHTAVWHNQLPGWVTSGNFNKADLTSIIQNHTKNLVAHFKEPFNEDGTFRSSVFYDTLGSSYISIALQAARAADPAAKLYINDYNIDGTGAKSTGMLNLVKSLKAAGTPIDGVGLQAHLIVGQIPSTIKANIQQFTALGVEVAITELDIRMTLPVTAEKLAQQKQDYQTVIAACKAVSGCVGVTIWDYTDKYSWIPAVFQGQGSALVWDDKFVKKPAYDGIVAGFQS
ncbi:hypothetical protein H0H81_000566 [Sphagnurus paluster]|uniref:Beta-xylanase n=1 Tax=Sphagnurus paluster TaxID=117069 RepID=A0A9P7K300_9AGAR|nr:hypothetical protein H0H81_000566 [Sphagnurus paluster]